MDPIVMFAALLAAVAVLLIFFALFNGRRGDVEERLERYASANGGKEKPVVEKAQRQGLGRLVAGSSAFASFNRVVERRNWSADMARDLARADLVLKPGEFLAIRAAAIIGLPAVVFLLGATVVPTLSNPIALVVGAIVGFWLPRFWLGHRQGKRLKTFNKNLADTITLIANALRSGSSFLQAIEMVVRETQPPISTEFGRVIREVNLGLPFDQALENMVRRVRSDDLELMATAISIQHQVGGNLAEILDSIAYTIRERVRIKGEIRTLTAQQRLSGYVVAGLPVGLAGFLFVAAPGFMAPMFLNPPAVLGLPAGVVILCVGGFMMFLGFMFIRKIVDIEV
jgi:tight adherence protein B